MTSQVTFAVEKKNQTIVLNGNEATYISQCYQPCRKTPEVTSGSAIANLSIYCRMSASFKSNLVISFFT
jgi:hypothetical protein